MAAAIDEHADTINDSLFVVDMGPENQMPDMPSDRHGKSYCLSFTDGHLASVKLSEPLANWMSSAPAPDSDWVKLKGWTTLK